MSKIELPSPIETWETWETIQGFNKRKNMMINNFVLLMLIESAKRILKDSVEETETVLAEWEGLIPKIVKELEDEEIKAKIIKGEDHEEIVKSVLERV